MRSSAETKVIGISKKQATNRLRIWLFTRGKSSRALGPRGPVQSGRVFKVAVSWQSIVRIAAKLVQMTQGLDRNGHLRRSFGHAAVCWRRSNLNTATCTQVALTRPCESIPWACVAKLRRYSIVICCRYDGASRPVTYREVAERVSQGVCDHPDCTRPRILAFGFIVGDASISMRLSLGVDPE